MFFFLMCRPPPISTRTDTLVPYAPLFRSVEAVAVDTRLEGGDALLRLHHLLVERDGKAGATEIAAAPRGHLVDGVDHRLRGLFARQLVGRGGHGGLLDLEAATGGIEGPRQLGQDRKSTRLNSSH